MMTTPVEYPDNPHRQSSMFIKVEPDHLFMELERMEEREDFGGFEVKARLDQVDDHKEDVVLIDSLYETIDYGGGTE